MTTNSLADDRRIMIARHLRGRGIRSQRVLDAMARVPREQFLPENMRASAYSDCALSIDCGQTISQPYMVALMTELLDLNGTELVLEVGTGSGYQTAVLAELCQRVVSIERHAHLSRQAGIALDALGYENIELAVGDGSRGCPAAAPFDRVLVAAAAGEYPEPLFEQLIEGGRFVIPLGAPDSQVLQVITKTNGRPVRAASVGCRFVPLIAGEPPLP
jgi:protein-L-isoaspartate(D-aspartate) O-methyltransferase